MSLGGRLRQRRCVAANKAVADGADPKPTREFQLVAGNDGVSRDAGKAGSAMCGRGRINIPSLSARRRPARPMVDRNQQRRRGMSYADGFVLAVPKARLEEYKAMARLGGTVWKEHGALAYVECTGDDVPYGELTSFPRAVQAKEDEVVIFSWIVYESRAARDEIVKKVMADPRLTMPPAGMPFDGKRMIYGGFEVFVEL
jgi:uncharacterized protein YbaA (DUF1428 family)